MSAAGLRATALQWHILSLTRLTLPNNTTAPAVGTKPAMLNGIEEPTNT